MIHWMSEESSGDWKRRLAEDKYPIQVKTKDALNSKDKGNREKL